jgi:hypothetical protein
MSIQEYCIIRDYAYCCHLLALAYEVRIGIFLFFGSFASFPNFLSHPCFQPPFLPCFCISFLHFMLLSTQSPFLFPSSFLYSLSPVFLLSHPSSQLLSFLNYSSHIHFLSYHISLLSLALIPFFKVHKRQTLVGSVLYLHSICLKKFCKTKKFDLAIIQEDIIFPCILSIRGMIVASTIWAQSKKIIPRI